MENLKLKNKLIAIKLLYNVHSAYFQVDLVKCFFLSNSSANRQVGNENNVWIKSSVQGYEFTLVGRLLPSMNRVGSRYEGVTLKQKF